MCQSRLWHHEKTARLAPGGEVSQCLSRSTGRSQKKIVAAPEVVAFVVVLVTRLALTEG
jgi:hypothetical protein